MPLPPTVAAGALILAMRVEDETIMGIVCAMDPKFEGTMSEWVENIFASMAGHGMRPLTEAEYDEHCRAVALDDMEKRMASAMRSRMHGQSLQDVELAEMLRRTPSDGKPN